MNGCSKSALVIALAVWLSPSLAFADATEDLARRLDRLELENKQLRHDLDTLKSQKAQQAAPANTVDAASVQPPRQSAPQQRQAQADDPQPPPPLRPSQADKPSVAQHGASGRGFVGFDNDYSYAMLDPTVAGKTKPLTLMQAKRSGELDGNSVIIGGAITAIADYQHTNRPDDFGYLMRQSGANHVGSSVSEAVLHTAQVEITANLTSWLSTYAEILYDPEQSFGAGTITALDRNQLQLRRGYVLIGDLDWAPVYAQIGKIDSPFGQTDTVNPFSLSSDWHTFSGLSYGALVGYSRDGLKVTAEAVQGGAEFRGLNGPVGGTAVPSELNNYVFDANYTLNLGQRDRSIMAGASYEGGSSFCQPFPIQHFGDCDKANPAWAVYSTLQWDAFELRGEYMQTVHAWPGTFNPNPPLDVFAASKVTSFDVGGKYVTSFLDRELDLSLDYSAFLAGPDGSPWHRQSQFVAGLAYFILPNAKLFSEVVLIEGYEPLQFLTGGIPGEPITETESDPTNRTQVYLTGVNVAF